MRLGPKMRKTTPTEKKWVCSLDHVLSKLIEQEEFMTYNAADHQGAEFCKTSLDIGHVS